MDSKIIEVNVDELKDFIFRSKKKCFARTDTKTSMNDQTSIYSNRELPWCYTDIYKGNTVERGTEEVSLNMVPVWSMQYRGGYLEDFWSVSEELGGALKHALMNIPKAFPFRGPELLYFNEKDVPGLKISGDFKYVNNWKGDIKRFVGEERIYWNDKEIFYHDYMGGFIRDKYYPVVLK